MKSLLSHKIISLILFTTILLSLSQNTAHAVTLTNVTGRVDKANGTYLRTGPSTNDPSTKLLPNNTPLTMLLTSSDWFKASISDGTTGWVCSGCTLLTGTGSPSTIYTRGNSTRKMVSLTFDAGSDLGYTGKILDTLKYNNIKSSFGITGDWASKNPNMLKRIASEDHELINHTLKHYSYTGVSTSTKPRSAASRLSNIVATENIFFEITGKTSKPLWRPPYGDLDSGVLRDVGALGFSKTIMWDIDSFGWNGLSSSQIHERVVSRVQNGSIILFHVGSQSQDANALQNIINTLKNRGYTFGTVTQVIAP